jgi:hypothetical protein
MMNVVARMATRALREHGVPKLPAYRQALVSACNAFPPPFGGKAYSDLYRESATDPEWVALSLATNSLGEGEGAQHAYITLLELVFPEAVDEQLWPRLQELSPGYTKRTPLTATKGSPYAIPATVDELIQMNIAEIRTRTLHLLQRPVLLAYCSARRRARVRRILDSLLLDETRHIAYTARLIERAAQDSGIDQVMDLMRERIRDFNEITDDDIARRTLVAS